MELCIGYLYIIIITFSWKTCKVQGNTDHSLVKPLDIVKRYLRWNNNGYIVPSEGSSYEVMYLQPHPANVAVKSDGNYLAFTLYMRNGREEAQNTGVFHFIDADIAKEKRSHCTRKAMHEGAYYHFYGKCPENEQRIVASGYCYQGPSGRGLIYNSMTFNSAAMSYVDGRYYLNKDRTVHPYEENLIKVCFNNWKDSGFQVHSWKCSTKDVPFASGLTSDFGKRSKRASTVCNDCECIPGNGSSGVKYVDVMIVFMSLLSVQIKMHQ